MLSQMEMVTPWKTKMNREEGFVSVGVQIFKPALKARGITNTDISCGMFRKHLTTSVGQLIVPNLMNPLLWRKMLHLTLMEFRMEPVGVPVPSLNILLTVERSLSPKPLTSMTMKDHSSIRRISSIDAVQLHHEMRTFFAEKCILQSSCWKRLSPSLMSLCSQTFAWVLTAASECQYETTPVHLLTLHFCILVGESQVFRLWILRFCHLLAPSLPLHESIILAMICELWDGIITFCGKRPPARRSVSSQTETEIFTVGVKRFRGAQMLFQPYLQPTDSASHLSWATWNATWTSARGCSQNVASSAARSRSKRLLIVWRRNWRRQFHLRWSQGGCSTKRQHFHCSSGHSFSTLTLGVQTENTCRNQWHHTEQGHDTRTGRRRALHCWTTGRGGTRCPASFFSSKKTTFQNKKHV